MLFSGGGFNDITRSMGRDYLVLDSKDFLGPLFALRTVTLGCTPDSFNSSMMLIS